MWICIILTKIRCFASPLSSSTIRDLKLHALSFDFRGYFVVIVISFHFFLRYCDFACSPSRTFTENLHDKREGSPCESLALFVRMAFLVFLWKWTSLVNFVRKIKSSQMLMSTKVMCTKGSKQRYSRCLAQLVYSEQVLFQSNSVNGTCMQRLRNNFLLMHGTFISKKATPSPNQKKLGQYGNYNS